MDFTGAAEGKEKLEARRPMGPPDVVESREGRCLAAPEYAGVGARSCEPVKRAEGEGARIRIIRDILHGGGRRRRLRRRRGCLGYPRWRLANLSLSGRRQRAEHQ